MHVPPLAICKLLPHFLFAPLCRFSPVQIYLSVFTQKSVLQVFVLFRDTPIPLYLNKRLRSPGPPKFVEVTCFVC